MAIPWRRGLRASVGVILGSAVAILINFATGHSPGWAVLVGLLAAIALWAAWAGWEAVSSGSSSAQIEISQKVQRLEDAKLTGWHGPAAPGQVRISQEVGEVGPGSDVTGFDSR